MNKRTFKKEVCDITNVAVSRANEYLSNLNLTLSVNWEYDEWDDIYDGDAVGVYEVDSVFSGKISIGFNMDLLYKSFKQMCKNYPWSNQDTMLDEIIQTNVFHEMAHGIVQLMLYYLQETDELDALYDNNKNIFDYVFDNEEDAVESFAWNFYDNSLEDDELSQMVNLYLNAFNQQENKQYNTYKQMNKKLIRLTESDLNRIVKESVNRILKEYGDTPKGQKMLGAMQARKFMNADGDTADELLHNADKASANVYDYAAKQRQRDGKDLDMWGNIENPMYNDYAKGYIEYMDAHPEEYAKRKNRLRKLGYDN